MYAWWWACAVESDPGTTHSGPTGRPLVQILPADDDLPLVRILEVQADEPSEVEATWTDGEHTEHAVAAAALDHALPLLRLRADRRWEAEVTVRGPSGERHETLTFDVGPLPEPFPELLLHHSEAGRVAPGDTLFGADGGAHWSLVVDAGGEVVWAWRHPTRIMELQLTDEGVLLGVPERNGGPFEIDWAARYRRRFLPAAQADVDAIPVDVRLFHHDVQPMSDGRVLALTNDRIEAASFPVSYQTPTIVSEGEPVRVDRAIVVGPDGAVLESYPLDDHLPLSRIGYDALDGDVGGRNWTHANGVIEHGDALLISARNQDALVAVDRTTGTTRWILANPANWPPDREALRLQAVGPIRWPYHQHAPEWSGDEILVFDNGNHQASPWTGERNVPGSEVETRIAAFRIDEVAGTVAEAWSFTHPDHRYFCPYLGDADRLPGGTVLADYANVTKVDGAPTSELGRGASLVRLVEFQPETGEIVWDLEVRGHEGERGWSSFRAQRIDPDWVAGAW